MATATRSNKAVKESVYEIVTRHILDALDRGTIPWEAGHNSTFQLPVNLKTKKEYRGINVWLLYVAAIEKGYTSPYWLSYKQAASMGGQVRKGEKSTLITFWKIDKDKRDPEGKKTYAILRYYNVFNVEQIDGLEGKIPASDTEKLDFSPIEMAEQIVAGYDGPEILENGAGPDYNPATDVVRMPKREDWKSEDRFYKTLFHELTHSTGHADRLKREGCDTPHFGTETYGKEELIAEMGASFLAAMAGILSESLIENAAAYIEGWQKAIRSDPKFVVQAAGAAQKAVDLIVGKTFDNAEDSAENDA